MYIHSNMRVRVRMRVRSTNASVSQNQLNNKHTDSTYFQTWMGLFNLMSVRHIDLTTSCTRATANATAAAAAAAARTRTRTTGQMNCARAIYALCAPSRTTAKALRFECEWRATRAILCTYSTTTYICGLAAKLQIQPTATTHMGKCLKANWHEDKITLAHKHSLAHSSHTHMYATTFFGLFG